MHFNACDRAGEGVKAAMALAYMLAIPRPMPYMVVLDHWLPFSCPSGTGESVFVAEEELGVPAGANPHKCSNRRSGSALKSDGQREYTHHGLLPPRMASAGTFLGSQRAASGFRPFPARGGFSQLLPAVILCTIIQKVKRIPPFSSFLHFDGSS
jgi:hypothetical protein